MVSFLYTEEIRKNYNKSPQPLLTSIKHNKLQEANIYCWVILMHCVTLQWCSWYCVGPSVPLAKHTYILPYSSFCNMFAFVCLLQRGTVINIHITLNYATSLFLCFYFLKHLSTETHIEVSPQALKHSASYIFLFIQMSWNLKNISVTFYLYVVWGNSQEALPRAYDILYRNPSNFFPLVVTKDLWMPKQPYTTQYIQYI